MSGGPDRSRREFLRALGAAAATAGALGAAGSWLGGCGRTGARRPSFLFVLTDDHRHDALGCAGLPWLRTPNLDRLAGEGVRFTDAFTTTSLCSPSRAGFLTGCWAHRHGVVANEMNDPDPRLPQLPGLLQAAGWTTAFVGKWHMARWSSPRPGWDHWVAFNRQGDYERNTLNVDGRWELSRRYVTDDLTDRALAFLRDVGDRPFFLLLSHKAAHAPFVPPPRYADLYADAPVQELIDRGRDLAGKPDWGGRGEAPADAADVVRRYLACLTAVDDGVGRLLAELERRGRLEDTVVVYAGDNGFLLGEHGGLWDKRAAYEPSIRIPLLVRAHGFLPPGRLQGGLALNVDLAPTLLAMAGLPPPASMQGRSWLDLVAGRPWRDAFLYEYFREEGNVPTTLAVREERWKLVTYPEDDLPDELYDLAEDPGELRNLAADPARAEQVRRLRDRLALLERETDFRPPPRPGRA